MNRFLKVIYGVSHRVCISSAKEETVKYKTIEMPVSLGLESKDGPELSFI